MILNDTERVTTIDDELDGFKHYYAKVKKERKRKIKYTTFVRVIQVQPIGALTNKLKLRLAPVSVWITPKFTELMHLRRIDFLRGVNVRHSDLTWYTKTIEDTAGLEQMKIEIRAECTYVHLYNAKTYVLYAIHNEAQQIDKRLTSKHVMAAFNQLHFTYVSFKYSSSDLIMKQLHWTNLRNQQVKYETLHNVYLHTNVTNKFDNTHSPLRHMLMSLKTHEGQFLLVGVEQERSINRKHEVFLLYYPSMKDIVNKWLTEQ